MIKSYDRTPLSRIEFLERFQSPPKTHIKISNHKLPVDFFSLKNTSKLCSSTSVTRNQSQTQQISRNSYIRGPIKSDMLRRDNMTARETRNKE